MKSILELLKGAAPTVLAFMLVGTLCIAFLFIIWRAPIPEIPKEAYMNLLTGLVSAVSTIIALYFFNKKGQS